jgi:2-polyprenyl-3-methyl-5-hydroxy-6-metoxy-1,4-benzoquinol methylase
MTEVLECPICSNRNLLEHMQCRDHTVSNEIFQLKRCEACNLLITTPRPEELSKYYQSDNYISHNEESQNAFAKIYSLARRITIKWKVGIVKKYLSVNSADILDIGCGTGTFLKACKDHGLSISGVEPSLKARTIATKVTEANILADTNEVKGKFHAITLWHVLEHIPDLDKQLRLLRELLHPEGIILIAVPNHESPDARKYKSVWAGYDVPRHLWHFSRTSIGKLFEYSQLTHIDTIPMKLDSFYVSMLSEKYRNGSLGLVQFIKGMWSGLLSNTNSGKAKNYSSLIYIARRK